MTIDVWMQHPTLRFLRSDMLASLRRWTGGSMPDTDIPIEATIASMDAADVDFGLLSAWRGPNGQDLVSNDEVAEWIRSHPNRFAGLATVDLDRPMEAIRELRRRVRTTDSSDCGWCPGCGTRRPPTAATIRCSPNAWSRGCRSAPRSDTPARCDRRRPDARFPTSTRWPSTFPELVIVCGHVGYPWTEEMVAVARKHENVYIDTSAYTIKRLPEELIRFMKTGTGQRKVLFGTNYPMIAHEHALAGLDELGLSDEARRDFLHGNAERVFGLANREVTT